MKSLHMKFCLACAGFLFALVIWVTPASAFKVVRDSVDSSDGPLLLVLPYAFNSESSGTAFGIGAAYSRWPQEQAVVGGTIWQTSENTGAVYLNLTDLQLPITKRLFLTMHGFNGSYPRMSSYASGVSVESRAGDNDSEKDSEHVGYGWDQWFEAQLTFVMPWGPVGDSPIHTYHTEKGRLKDGSVYRDEYNPMISGRSFVKVMPFYRRRWFRDEAPVNSDVETKGIKLTFEYDNSDFFYDPSKGSTTKFIYTQGFGDRDSRSWSLLEFDFAKYWDLGDNSWFEKQVAAFNFWIADTPSWEENENGEIRGDSPYYMGAVLGGFKRQRGFPFYRFHDKSAINYAFEYRVIPHWNPLSYFSWFKWWEFVPFAELGRVGPYINPEQLHTNMKFSGGLGVRMMILNSVVRVDAAGSREGMNVWAMVNQTF